MSESTAINVQAYEPYNGGEGARLSATTATGNVAIPGLEGGLQSDRSRVLITNPNAFSVYVRMGGSSITATLTSTRASQEILAGTQVLLKPPQIGSQPLYMAAIVAAGSGYVTVCSGVGT